MFICGGCADSDTMLQDCRLYDLDTNSYTRAGDVPDLPTPRGLICCSPLKNGCVFVCGGSDGRSSLADAIVIDTILKEMYCERDLPLPRSRHGCCTLPDGRVFICGGLYGGTHGNLSDALLFSSSIDGGSPDRAPPHAGQPFNAAPTTLLSAAPKFSMWENGGESGSDDGAASDVSAPSAYSSDAVLLRGDKSGSSSASLGKRGVTLEEWLKAAEAALETAASKEIRGNARAVRRDWDSDTARAREKYDKAIRKCAEARVRHSRELLKLANLIGAVPEIQGEFSDAIRDMTQEMSPERSALRSSHTHPNSSTLTNMAAGTTSRKRPDQHICPISHEVMSAPVMISCGHTFEQSVIAKWFLNNETCPTCRTPVVTTAMIPNIALRQLIEKW